MAVSENSPQYCQITFPLLAGLLPSSEVVWWRCWKQIQKEKCQTHKRSMECIGVIGPDLFNVFIYFVFNLMLVCYLSLQLHEVWIHTFHVNLWWIVSLLCLLRSFSMGGKTSWKHLIFRTWMFHRARYLWEYMLTICYLYFGDST